MASSSFASSSLVSSLEYPDIPDKYCHLLLPSLKQVFDRKKLCRRHARGHGWSSGCGFINVKVKMCCFVVYVLVPLNPKKWVKSRGDLAFTVKGFSNFKDGTIGIKKHKESGSHKGAFQVMMVIPSTCRDVGDMLVKQHKQEKKDNRQCLLKIISNVKFLDIHFMVMVKK